MAILDFLATHWDSILVVVLTCLVLVLLYIKGQKKIVYKILYGIAAELQKQFGEGTGALKQSYAIEKIYSMMPAFMKSIVSVKQLEKWVDDGVKKIKEEWKQNAKVTEYIEGGEKNDYSL